MGGDRRHTACMTEVLDFPDLNMTRLWSLASISFRIRLSAVMLTSTLYDVTLRQRLKIAEYG